MMNVGMNLASESQLRPVTAKAELKQAVNVGTPAEKKPEKDDGQAKKLTAVTAADKDEDSSNVVKAIDTVNQMLMVKSTNLVFEFHDKEDPPVVKVIDKENGDVIREIPSKELREIAKALNSIADNMGSNSGILFNERL
jgi:uncharacterized FlaG/YvyC family protein